MTGRPQVAERSRGQPLVALALICGGWFALRIVLWQSPFGLPNRAAMRLPAALVSAHVTRNSDRARRDSTATKRSVPGPDDAPAAEPLPAPWLAATNGASVTPSVLMNAERPTAHEVIGHQLLLAAAFAHMEMPAAISPYFTAASLGERPAPSLAGDSEIAGPPAVPGRWTGDAWLLARNGSSGPLAPGQPSYGRNQAGAVLRYRLAPGSGLRPVAYVRATRALAGSRESEVAAGLAARPLVRVPLSLAGEVRVSQGPAGREVRPAAFAVTELPPVALPLGLRAEAYAQAGYVGGHFATAFVDGQARLDTLVTMFGRDTRVRAGGGVWGGAQKHAARLDIGPSAVVNFRIGETQSRVALDYRLRVAGDAAPKNGPALTISAGF